MYSGKEDGQTLWVLEKERNGAHRHCAGEQNGAHHHSGHGKNGPHLHCAETRSKMGPLTTLNRENGSHRHCTETRNKMGPIATLNRKKWVTSTLCRDQEHNGAYHRWAENNSKITKHFGTSDLAGIRTRDTQQVYRRKARADNKTKNTEDTVSLVDTHPRLHQGVLYCQHVTLFHGTRWRVIALMSIQKSIAFAALIFTKLTNVLQHYVQITYTIFHPHRTIHVEITWRNSFTPFRKVWPSMSWFSR
jgi:hypothetical protein